jgi:seryl-tRNA synthetase
MTVIQSIPSGDKVASSDRLSQIAEALFRPLGSDGVYARTALYEDVVERLTGLISRLRDPSMEILRFPPVISRSQIERSGYLKSFPNLLGCVSVLGPDHALRHAGARDDPAPGWEAGLAATDLVLAPAACYPVYPLAAGRGPVPEGGLKFDVACDCFRREQSRQIDRFQSFRMREFVFIGGPQEVMDFRQRWIERGLRLAAQLGLSAQSETASDPFFGRVGQMMALSQVQQELKFELLVPVRSAQEPTACMSFNYHRDHFGSVWQLRDRSDAVCHTACVAFGIDRLAVALFAQHGLDLSAWPAGVRTELLL